MTIQGRVRIRRCFTCAGLTIPLILSCLVTFEDYPVGRFETSRGGFAGESGGAASGAQGNAATANAGAGGTEQAGASATAGLPGAGGGLPIIRENTIDDFEDEDTAILSFQNRNGHWHGYNDGSGVQTPPLDKLIGEKLSVARPGSGSTQGLHLTASGFTGYGAIARAQFREDENGNRQTYDVTQFKGIAFFGRRESDSRPDVWVAVPSVGTLEDCTTCSDHFGMEVQLTLEWVDYYLPFESLKQKNFGIPQLEKLELTKVYGVQFNLWSGAKSNIWIDGLRFY